MKKDKVRILMLEKYKLLKEAEKLYQKAQELHREYLKICQERGRKLQQANLVENQIYVDEFKLEPVSMGEKDEAERKG